jgi:CRISPR-associated protein Cas2
MILERVTPSLRGELTRWLIQPKAGVFVGRISALVRDKLWEKVGRSLKTGGAIMIYSSNTEQGFAIQTQGSTNRSIEDFEGVFLVKVPRKT